MLTVKVKHTTVDGKRLIHIPLDVKKGGTDFCTMEQSAFNDLLDLGVPPLFKYKNGCVWVRSKGKARYSKSADVCVARVMLDCEVGQTVRYLDQNPKNLCSSNLLVCHGMSLYKARDLISKQFPPTRYELEHEGLDYDE